VIKAEERLDYTSSCVKGLKTEIGLHIIMCERVKKQRLDEASYCVKELKNRVFMRMRYYNV